MELKGPENLEPAVIVAAAQAQAGKCLVEKDMLLHSMCREVINHPDRVKKLFDISPQFRRELAKHKELYERSRRRW